MEWWADAVVYHVYVRSFTDTDGDGVGDLDGVRSRLGYLELLGVDAIALTPIFSSPMIDHGYDVADARAVDPVFGDNDTFDRLLASAHEHALRVVIDLVPNHTSSEHEWFRAALSSAPGSPERARYHFRPGRGDDGSEPPNNWRSIYGGPAWTRLPDPGRDAVGGEWYLHLFGPEEPDLNWANPEVRSDLEKTLRFWLDRGADGVRLDLADGMSKPAELPDAPDPEARLLTHLPGDPRFDDDGVHEVHRMIRTVVDEYPGRLLAGELRVDDTERFARYVRADELHVGVGTPLVRTPFDADAVRAAIEGTLAAATGARPAWTLSNPHVSRPVTRYGGGQTGLARARAMVLVQLALPGVVHLYNGDELGLPDADLPDEALQDSIWQRSGNTERGRDAYRVPLPWEGGPPGYGFTVGDPWLPIPAEYGQLTVADQLEDTTSMLSLLRRGVELRKTHPGFAGGRGVVASGAGGRGELEWFGAPPGCFAFRRAGTTFVCALNTSQEAVPLPPGEVLLASGSVEGGHLPPDTAVWLA